MENRRLLLAVFLSALILILWNSIFPPAPPPPRPTADPVADQLAEEAPPSQGAQDSRVSESAFEGSDEATAGEPDLEAQNLIEFESEIVASEHEDRQVLENESVRLEFSNRGAQLVSFQLKQHQTPGGELLELVRDRGSDPYPFALVVGGEKQHRLNNALFAWDQESSDGNPALRFKHRSDRGAAEKVFSLRPDGLVSVQMTVLGSRDWSVVLGPGLRNLTADELGNRFIQRQVGYRRGESLEEIAPAKQESDEFIPALGLRWVTLEDNFFLLAVMPENGVQEIVVKPVFQREEFQEDEPRFLPIESQSEGEGLSREQLLLLEASGQQMELVTLFGAKRYSRLVKLPYGLEETVRWGWFGFLAKPLYYALEWIYSNMVSNYGWAIVLVTCLIRVLFFPLTHKSQESMGKMQELNPKVQAIRTKYRSKLKDKQGRPNADAQRQMNEEVMKVYKTAGVNPAAGCLPMLLQMPVFFAFFRLLSTAVELRDAPWIGWIKDLSVPDPIYVLPILMGVTSIAMQRMMPSAPDPMQRRMMQLLPIMFMFFAFAFPAGLVLYWVTNNLLSMLQQGVMMQLKKRLGSRGLNDSTEEPPEVTANMERQFFSGNSVEQAILAAARHHGLDPSRVAYKLREKKHGFVNVRRRVVIEVDPAAPEQPEETLQQTPPTEAESPTSRDTDRRPAPRYEAPRRETPRYEAPRYERPRHEDREEMRWQGAEISWDGKEMTGEVAAIEKALKEIAQLLDLRLEISIGHGEDGFEIDLSGDGSDSLLDDRGQALDAIEHLLPRMVRGLLGHGIRCRIDSGGFRAAHETELRQLAEEAAEDVRRDSREQMLEPMNPADRRLVHMALAEDPTVQTESEGQGFLKRVRISPV